MLTSEDQKEPVLDRVVEIVDPVVALDDVFRGGEIAVEERLGASRDRLGGERGEPDDVDADLVELLVEGLADVFGRRFVGNRCRGHGLIVPRGVAKWEWLREPVSTLHWSFT